MDLPTNKEALLAALEHGRAIWDALLARLDAATMAEPEVEGDWSVRDILAHVVAYEQYAAAHAGDLARHGTPSGQAVAALDAYHREQLAAYRREHPDAPDDVEKLGTDQLNDLFVTEWRAVSLAELLAQGRRAYDDTVGAVILLSEEALAAPQQIFGDRSMLRMLPYQSYIHYEKHAVWIERWLAQRGQ
ncbi:MAG: DinB family protein [Kouleothrix sp.]|nr:DinB family protein [Kouleothrix sp.]